MQHRVCPWWLGYFLVNPLRKLYQSPEKILSPYLKPGMTVLDIGCGMGFFSIPMARMVGKTGKVFCVDVQEKMLRSLQRRSRRAGVEIIIQPRLCSTTTLELSDVENSIDFVLAFAVLHEVPDMLKTMEQVQKVLKEDGRLLLAEPKIHVSGSDFKKTIKSLEQQNFQTEKTPIIAGCHAILFKSGVL